MTQHPYGNEYYTSRTEDGPTVAYRTKAAALKTARLMRADFPDEITQVCRVLDGQSIAVSTDDWQPFPTSRIARAAEDMRQAARDFDAGLVAPFTILGERLGDDGEYEPHTITYDPSTARGIAGVPWDDDDAPLVRAPSHTGYAYCSEAEYHRLTADTPPAADLCGTYRHRAIALSGEWCDGHMGIFEIVPPRNEYERAYGLIMIFADGKESYITASAVAACIRRGVYERLAASQNAPEYVAPTCPRCDGERFVAGESCPVCGGSGKKPNRARPSAPEDEEEGDNDPLLHYYATHPVDDFHRNASSCGP